MNYDLYKNLEYNEDSSPSLEEFNEKISPFKIEEVISEIFDKNKIAGERTRIMEIGPGNGRVLMTLKKKFPDVEFYALKRRKTHTFYRRESFILTALKFGIFNQAQVDDITLPYLVFQEFDFGNRIPYDENKFDLVFSQRTLPTVKYKFELFNEIMRILKPSGLSFLADVNGINIYSKGVLLDMKEAMNELRKKGIEIYSLERPTSIRFKKPNFNLIFPVSPHQPVPTNSSSLSAEARRPEMGYNIIP